MVVDPLIKAEVVDLAEDSRCNAKFASNQVVMLSYAIREILL